MTDSHCPDCQWPLSLSSDACAICGRHFRYYGDAEYDPENVQYFPLPSAEQNLWERNKWHLNVAIGLILGWFFLWRILFGLQALLTAFYFLTVGVQKCRQITNPIVRHRVPVLHESAALSGAGLLLLIVLWGSSWIGSPKLGPPVPAEYQTLAKHLHSEIHNSPEAYSRQHSTAELLANLHTAILELEAIQTSDQQLRYIKDEALAVIRETKACMERLEALPKPPAADQLLAESLLLGFYSGFTGDPSGITLGFGSIFDADQKRAALLQEIETSHAAFNQVKAVQRLLPKIAQRYAATSVTYRKQIGVDLNGLWGSACTDDWLSLYNNGPALANCTIQVTLKGAAGENETLVHFVPHWPAGTWQYARYQPGILLGERMIGRTTVAEIQSVEIQLWSPSFSTSLTYIYQGKERDEDIARYCQNLKLESNYQHFQKGVLWNTERSASIRMTGLSWIPAGRLHMTFQNGESRQTYYDDFPYWQTGEVKKIEPPAGKLPSDPDHLGVTLTFPNSNYQHRVTFTVD